MATIVHRYVDPDATGAGTGVDWANAYTSLRTVAPINRNLVTNDEAWIVHCRSSAGTADVAASTVVTWNGWTVNATHYIEVRCDDDDTYGHNRHSGKWDVTKYRVVTTALAGAVLNVTNQNYIRFIGIQALNSYAAGVALAASIGASSTLGILFDKCILLADGLTGQGFGCAGAAVVLNSMIRGGLRGVNVTTGTLHLYNCVARSRASSGGHAIGLSSTGTLNAKNCYAKSNGTSPGYNAGSGTLNLTTCYSDDGSAGSTVAAYSTTSGAYFLDITADAENFHVAASSDFVENGTNLGSDPVYPFADDIDGQPRGLVWDVGLDEVSVATIVERLIQDGLGVSDTSQRVMTCGRGLADGVGLTDARSRFASLSRGMSDAVGVGSAAARSVRFVRGLSSAIGASAAASRMTTHKRSLAAAVGVSDAVRRIKTALRALADALATRDQIAVLFAPGTNLGLVTMPTAAEIRQLLENYGITSSVISDEWLETTRDDYVIPWVEGKIRKSLTKLQTVEEFYSGNGEPVLVLRRRPVVAIVSISYTDVAPDQPPLSAAAVTLLAAEGMVRARVVDGQYCHTFRRGTKNLRVRYQVGYTDPPPKLRDAIKCLVAEEALGQIADQTGGGNLTVQSFGRQYGNRGKYTNIRNQLARRALASLRSEMTGVGSS